MVFSKALNIAQSSPELLPFEKALIDGGEVQAFESDDRHPPTRKRKRLYSPTIKSGSKRPKLSSMDGEQSAAALRSAVAGFRQNSSCIRCRVSRERVNSTLYKADSKVQQSWAHDVVVDCGGNLPCDHCISESNSICLWQPCVRVACSDLDLFGLGNLAR